MLFLSLSLFFYCSGCGSDEADNETVKKDHIVDKENGKKINIPPKLAEFLGSEFEVIETEERVKKSVDEQVLLVIEEAKPLADRVYKDCTQADIENWRKIKDKPNILFDGKDYRTGKTGKRLLHFDCARYLINKFDMDMSSFCYKNRK